MRTCDELGVCNGRHCNDVSACPDYDLIACNSGPCDGADNAPCPHDVWRCEVPCSPPPQQFEFAQPTYPVASATARSRTSDGKPGYPFAPGIIEGPPVPGGPFDAPWGVSLKDAAIMLGAVLLCSAAGGLLVAWLSGWPT